jgi:hypothetical protein
LIRDLLPSDIPQIKKIHEAQGFSYNLPDLSSPLILTKKVRVEGGRVVGACFLRVTAETFLVVTGSPVEKGTTLMELNPEILREAYEKGLSDIVCVVPPEISESFAPVLARLGWQHDRDWPMWSRSTNA